MKNHLRFAAFVCGALLAFSSIPASATVKDAVRNERGSAIHSRSGNCVRTRWDEGSDVCAAKAAEPAPAPAPAPKIVEAPRLAPVPPPAPIKKTVLKEEQATIYFDFDDAALTPESEAKLDALAGLLKQAKDIQRVDIVGYADKMGGSTHNIKLSERRAQAVEARLHESHYMNTSVAKVRGVGSSQAKAACSQHKNRARKIACQASDRKVVIEAVYSKDVIERP